MAFSRVELAPSQTFGCVLRDRNCRESNVDSAQKNVKVFVKERQDPSDENSWNRIDSWVKSQKANQKSRLWDVSSSPRNLKNSGKIDDNRQTRRMIDLWPAMSAQNRRFNAQDMSDSHQFESSKENPKEIFSNQHKKSAGTEKVGALALVQIWEARLHQSNISSSNQSLSSVSTESSSGLSDSDDFRSCLNERSRVADLIWKLSSDQEKDCHCKSGTNEMLLCRNAESARTLERIRLWPIRGRQALSEFLTKLESERCHELRSLSERQSVSMFRQRGRLQSMLRIRSLQRCVAIQDRHRSKSMACNINQQSSESTVLHLRFGFTPRFATKSIVCQRSDSHDLRESERKIANLKDRYEHQFFDTQENSSCEKETLREEQETNHQELVCLGSQESTEETKSFDFWGENVTLEEQESSDLQYYYGDTDCCDWINEVSQPRSYWEYLRKARYLEIVNTTSEKNEEISKLLKRRTVSDFLESDMRERIEKLMISRTQRQTHHQFEQESGEQECDVVAIEDRPYEAASDGFSQSYSQTFSESPPRRSWRPQDPSFDSELILDLKTKIERLQNEMLELRQSVQFCVDMQSQTHESVRHDSLLKHKCSNCSTRQVDSLLNRCRHLSPLKVSQLHSSS